MTTQSQLTRRSLLAALLGTTVLSVTACGGSDSGSGSATSTADNPYGLQTPGTLRVGTLTDAPPNVFLKDGKFTGFDNDLLTVIAATLDLKVEFVGTEFSSLLAQVSSGKFDVGSSSITVTEKRKQTVAFTHGYDFGYLGLNVPSGSAISGFDQLKGKRVVVVQGTVQDDYATKAGVDPVRVPDYNAAMNALRSGTAEAWVSPAEIGEKLAAESGGKVALAAKELSSSPMAYAVAKDNKALLEALNTGLDKVIADGTWKKLVDQYYPGREIPADFRPGSGQASVGG